MKKEIRKMIKEGVHILFECYFDPDCNYTNASTYIGNDYKYMVGYYEDCYTPFTIYIAKINHWNSNDCDWIEKIQAIPTHESSFGKNRIYKTESKVVSALITKSGKHFRK